KAAPCFSEHALDIVDDKSELGFEAVGQGALFVKAGSTRDEQQLAGARGERERWCLDVGGRSEVLDARHVLPFLPYWSAVFFIPTLQATSERDSPCSAILPLRCVCAANAHHQRPFFGRRIG